MLVSTCCMSTTCNVQLLIKQLVVLFYLFLVFTCDSLTIKGCLPKEPRVADQAVGLQYECVHAVIQLQSGSFFNDVFHTASDVAFVRPDPDLNNKRTEMRRKDSPVCHLFLTTFYFNLSLNVSLS